jgi:serine/threonine protein kinase
MSGLESLLSGRILGGRYLIEEVIGRGGMGAVYRAVDERLGRHVAVKVITVSGANDPEVRDRLRARFHREARAAAGLPHHPNVVPVYDYGTDEELGLDYIVMELLRGNDLATRLARSGPPPLAAALKILHQAARGLAVGHRAGLIHRDVKPGNIFLAQAGQDELQVRVVDFGIAKLADDEDTLNSLTQDGRAPHSPAYASPEQLRGLSNLTPASDVFSLGAVGYQLLTGERPFSDADRNRMSLGMPVPVPSLRSHNPAIPAPVEGIIQRALSFDPEDRFVDAGEMATALDRALRELPDQPLDAYPSVSLPPLAMADAEEPADEDHTEFMGGDDHTLLTPESPPAAPPPVVAAPAAPAERPARPPRLTRHAPEPRRRTAAVVWTLGLLALVAVVAWIVLQNQGRTAARQEPQPDTMAIVPAADSAAPDTVSAQPEMDAFIHNKEGNRLYDDSLYQAAYEQYRQAVDLQPDNAIFRRNMAVALIAIGQAPQAEQQLRQVLQLDPTQIIAYVNLAHAQLAQGDTTAAIESLETYDRRSPGGRAKQLAHQQLIALKASRAGLLGVPITPAPAPAPTPAPADTARRDTLPRNPGA